MKLEIVKEEKTKKLTKLVYKCKKFSFVYVRGVIK
jgi:hypothetical protein